MNKQNSARPDWKGAYLGSVILLGLFDFIVWFSSLMVGPGWVNFALFQSFLVAIPIVLLVIRGYFGLAGILEIIESVYFAVVILDHDYRHKLMVLSIFSLLKLLLGFGGVMLDEKFGVRLKVIAGRLRQ